MRGPNRGVLADDGRHDPGDEQGDAQEGDDRHHGIARPIFEIASDDEPADAEREEQEKRAPHQQPAFEPVPLVLVAKGGSHGGVFRQDQRD